MGSDAVQDDGGSPLRVPAPVPPGDPDAWYAPDVRAQYEVFPGVVATVRQDGDAFRYELREPSLSTADEAALDAVREHFADASPGRPRTREGTVERFADGFDSKHRRIVETLVDATDAARRRVHYYALRDLRCLGPVTPLALDDRVEVGDVAGDRIAVHTTDFAPARTEFSTNEPYLDRFLSERVERHTVPFREFRVPVVVYRERVLGTDAFDTKQTGSLSDIVHVSAFA